jgi:hypothetical protein
MRPRTRRAHRPISMQLHGASFELASVQEWISSAKAKVSRERLNPMKPVEAEEADVVTETVQARAYHTGML